MGNAAIAGGGRYWCVTENLGRTQGLLTTSGSPTRATFTQHKGPKAAAMPTMTKRRERLHQDCPEPRQHQRRIEQHAVPDGGDEDTKQDFCWRCWAIQRTTMTSPVQPELPCVVHEKSDHPRDQWPFGPMTLL